MSAEDQPSSARGNFFLVDVPTFERVCQLENADAAASYLILAAGTGGGGLITSWGRDAIAKRLAFNWRKADACVDLLCQNGFATWVEKSTRKPRLELHLSETRRPLAAQPARIAKQIKQVRAGEQPTTPTEIAYAKQAAELGWLECTSEHWRFAERRALQPAYLPLSLIGDEKGRVVPGASIVERVRKARDPMAFHLLANLYAAQDLAQIGGINRTLLRTEFKRHEVVANSKYQVLRFSSPQEWMNWCAATRPHQQVTTGEGGQAGLYFNRVRILEDAGALEWSYYLAEDNEPGSTLIYPVAVTRHGKLIDSEPETVVGSYALAAGLALAGRSDTYTFCSSQLPNEFTLPVDRLYRKAALVGIPRMRGRARTQNARQWKAELTLACEEWISLFSGLLRERDAALLDRLVQLKSRLQGEFKEASRVVQRDLKDLKQSGMHDPSALRAAARGTLSEELFPLWEHR